MDYEDDNSLEWEAVSLRRPKPGRGDRIAQIAGHRQPTVDHSATSPSSDKGDWRYAQRNSYSSRNSFGRHHIQALTTNQTTGISSRSTRDSTVSKARSTAAQAAKSKSAFRSNFARPLGSKENFPRVHPQNDFVSHQKVARENAESSSRNGNKKSPTRDKGHFEATGVLTLPSGSLSLTTFGIEGKELDVFRRKFGDIIFDQATKCLKVEAQNPEEVSLALKRLETLRNQMMQQQRPMLTFNLANITSDCPHPCPVEMINAEDCIVSSKSANLGRCRVERVPRLVPSIISPTNNFDGKEQLRLLASTNRQVINLAISDQSRYEQRSLRAKIGVIIFNCYVAAPKGHIMQDLVAFMKNLRDSRTLTSIHQLKQESHLLDRCFSCKSLLRPGIPVTSVAPIYRAVFGFWVTENGGEPDIQLEIEMTRDQETGNQAVRKLNWAASGKRKGISNLEIFMTRLRPGLSWKLEISSCTRSMKLAELRDFHLGVKLRAPFEGAATNVANPLMFDYPSDRPKGVFKQRFHQELVWPFHHRYESDILFEVVRSDFFDPETKSSEIKQTLASKHSEWHAMVYLDDWPRTQTDKVSMESVADSSTATTNALPLDSERAGGFNETREQRFTRRLDELVDALTEVHPWK